MLSLHSNTIIVHRSPIDHSIQLRVIIVTTCRKRDKYLRLNQWRDIAWLTYSVQRSFCLCQLTKDKIRHEFVIFVFSKNSVFECFIHLYLRQFQDNMTNRDTDICSRHFSIKLMFSFRWFIRITFSYLLKIIFYIHIFFY